MRLLQSDTFHEDDFEFFFDDLAGREPGIVSTDLKRGRGVAQYGVDVEAFDHRQRPVLVVSAKRYKKVAPADLRQWVDDFTDHWEGHWRRRNVRRFAVAVIVELNSDSLRAQITADSDRLEALGLQYEVWGTNQLTPKVRPHPDILIRYVHVAWVETICGRRSTDAPAFTAAHGAASSHDSLRLATSSLSDARGPIAERFGHLAASNLDDAI